MRGEDFDGANGDAFDVDDVSPPPEHGASQLLYTHRSPTLAEIAQPLLKDSINLYGEAVLRLNVPRGVFATNDAALEGLRSRLLSWGIAADAWQTAHWAGCGALTFHLQRMFKDPAGSAWMTAFPVAGRDGTLAERMRGTAAEGNLRAKTGTMSNIRALAGYVRTRDGETLAFAIIADNFEGPGNAAVAAIDGIAVRLAEFSRKR